MNEVTNDDLLSLTLVLSIVCLIATAVAFVFGATARAFTFALLFAAVVALHYDVSVNGGRSI